MSSKAKSISWNTPFKDIRFPNSQSKGLNVNHGSALRSVPLLCYIKVAIRHFYCHNRTLLTFLIRQAFVIIQLTVFCWKKPELFLIYGTQRFSLFILHYDLLLDLDTLWELKCHLQKLKSYTGTEKHSVADPNFSHPGSTSKNWSILTQKIFSKLSEIWSGLFILDPDPGSGSWFFTHPGSRIQGSKRLWILDPDQEHWKNNKVTLSGTLKKKFSSTTR